MKLKISLFLLTCAIAIPPVQADSTTSEPAQSVKKIVQDVKENTQARVKSEILAKYKKSKSIDRKKAAIALAGVVLIASGIIWQAGLLSHIPSSEEVVGTGGKPDKPVTSGTTPEEVVKPAADEKKKDKFNKWWTKTLSVTGAAAVGTWISTHASDWYEKAGDKIDKFKFKRMKKLVDEEADKQETRQSKLQRLESELADLPQDVQTEFRALIKRGDFTGIRDRIDYVLDDLEG